MQGFEKELFFTDIILPFKEDVLAKNILDDKRKYASLMKQNVQANRQNYIKTIKENVNKFNFESSIPNKNIQQEVINEFLFIELLFIKVIDIDKNIDDETRSLFLHILSIQLFVSQYFNGRIDDLNFYLNYSERVLNYFRNSTFAFDQDTKKFINLLKRSYYLILHNTNFFPSKFLFQECISLIEEDISFSKNISLKEKIISYRNYLDITLDHLLININIDKPYINLKIITHYQSELKTSLSQYIINENDNFLVYNCIYVILKVELFKIKLAIKKKFVIDEVIRTRLLLFYIEIIKIFYKEDYNLDLFFVSFNQIAKPDYIEVENIFNKYINKIMEDKVNNTNNLLFLIFNFLYNFKEYMQLNQNIYKALSYSSKLFYDRKIYLLSTILYLKSLNDINLFQKEVLKIKSNIESDPVYSLVTYYNNEIDATYNLETNSRDILKINPFIIQIRDIINKVKFLFLKRIYKLKASANLDKNSGKKIQSLLILENEFKNILIFAMDPVLINDLPKVYSYFLFSFFKKIDKEYRLDLEKKKDIIISAIVDINPLCLAVSIILPLIIKLDRFIKEQKPIDTGNNIDNTLPVSALQQIASEYIPEIEDKVDWYKLKDIIDNIGEPSIFRKNSILSPEARILSVIYFIIDIITKEGITDNLVFEKLYKDSYKYTKRNWDIDPIIIYYFNKHLSQKEKIALYDIKQEKVMEQNIHVYSNKIVQEKIDLFIKDIFENIKNINMDLKSEIETIININQEKLLDKEGNRIHITLPNIKYYIKNNITVFYEKHYIGEHDIIYIINIIKGYLTYFGKLSLFNTIIFIFKELVSNANNANLLRAFFLSKNIDIKYKYKIGLNEFNNEKKSNFFVYLNALNNSTLNTKIQMQVIKNDFIISVSNNYKINELELEEIDKRFKMVNNLKDLKDVYKKMKDSIEDKGLGLVVIILLLRKIGLNENYIKIETKENETIFKLTLPFDIIKEEECNKIAEEVINEIETVPTIPENIMKLKKLIHDPKSSFHEIEALILRDISLTANVIKLANSAFYMSASYIKTLSEAVKIIGIKGLSNLILIFSSYKLIENKIDKDKLSKIIEHSEETAYYARELINLKSLSVEIDDIYLAALLHDIGKIIVEGLNVNIYEKIQPLMVEKNIPIDVIEDLLGGLYHNKIGYLLTKKWQFPDYVCEVIKNHHSPRDAEKYFNETFLIYLANVFTYYNSDKITFENIDQNALEFFEIYDRNKIKDLGNNLKGKYQGYLQSTQRNKNN